jgi:glycosyltransferase involved in cell wall biosynthesis
MRVTHVITRLIVGGAQENTIASVLGLAAKPGLEVTLVSGPTYGPEGSLEKLVVGRGGLLNIEPALVRPIHPWKDAVAWFRLARLFRDEQPDLVHTHSGKAGLIGRLAAASAKVPVIVHTVHGPSFGSFQGPIPNAVFRSAERVAGRCTTHFVVVADAMRQQYLAAGIGEASQYTRIFSGFELDPFLKATNEVAYRARWGIQPGEVVIGKVARLFKLKGHEDLFAIAPNLVRRLPNLKFLLVGDGEYRERFQAMARQLGLEANFVFTGLVPPSEVARLLGIMDIVVHLSSREGLARVLPQALAVQRPVVAYDCDGANEVCLENETGFLIRPGDTATLAERLLRLAGDPALRQRFGEKGRSFVGARFGVQAMVEALYHLYVRLIEDPPTRPDSGVSRIAPQVERS